MEIKIIKIRYDDKREACIAIRHDLFVNQIVKDIDGNLYQVHSIRKNLMSDDKGFYVSASAHVILCVEVV